MALSALIDSSVVSGSAAHLCVLVCCRFLLRKGLHFFKNILFCVGVDECVKVHVTEVSVRCLPPLLSTLFF